MAIAIRARSVAEALHRFGALLLILGALAAAWLHASGDSFVPCAQDCGETLIAQHAVANHRLYGAKYGLLQDHATIPDPQRHPFLYTHNVHLGTLLFPLLDGAGLTSLWAKQLVTLSGFGAGLFYIFLTVRYVTRSTPIAFSVLLLFCTEYAQVLGFALNALRAWHWLALFGLVYHTLRVVSLQRNWRATDLIALAVFTALAFGIGYDFLAISGLVTVFVAIFCSQSWIRSAACVAWLGACIFLVFALRQIQVVSVLGFEYWYVDFLYSAVIKLTALAEYVSIPSIPDIDAFYRNHGVLRPFAAVAPLDQILLGIKRLFFGVTLPTAGLGSATAWLVGTSLSVALALLWGGHSVASRSGDPSVGGSWPRRLVAGLSYRDGDWVDANRTARFFLALMLGVVGGLIGFGSIALSIYLKHQFPLTAAVFLIPSGTLIALLLQFAVARRGQPGEALPAVALAVLLIVDHAATQLRNWTAIAPMSVAWIPEVLGRQDAAYAVSWIPSSVAGFGRNWVIGIQPGREVAAIERVNRGEPPFSESDLLEFNAASKDDIEKYDLLRPDYWLYFPTDQKLELQGVAPSCNRSYARRVFDDLVLPQEKPRLIMVNFERPAGAGTFAVALNVTGRAVAAVEVLYGGMVLARVGLDCDSRSVEGELLSTELPADRIRVALEAVAHNGQRYALGEEDVSLREQSSDRPASLPRRQPSSETLMRLNRVLPVAAVGTGFVLFDLRPLWKH